LRYGVTGHLASAASRVLVCGLWIALTARQARSCEMSLLVWSGISSVAMMLTTAQKAM
jgi:hypothetical protein